MNVRILIVECRSRRGRDAAVRAIAHALRMDVGLLRERMHTRPSWLLDLAVRDEAEALGQALGRLGVDTRVVPSIARADTACAGPAILAVERLSPSDSLVPDLVPTGPEKTTHTARGERTPAPVVPGSGGAPPPLHVRTPTPPAVVAARSAVPAAAATPAAPRARPAPAPSAPETRAGRPVRGSDSLPSRDPAPTPNGLPSAGPAEPVTAPREAAPREPITHDAATREPITLDAITTPLPEVDPEAREAPTDATAPLPPIAAPEATAPALPAVPAPDLVSPPAAGVIDATDPEFEALAVTAPFPRSLPDGRG